MPHKTDVSEVFPGRTFPFVTPSWTSTPPHILESHALDSPTPLQTTTMETQDLLTLPTSIRIISLNCWGLKYISTHRSARLSQIGHQLSIASPPPSIVGLQECWTQADFNSIRSQTRHILPYAKFYFSGIFGGGLAILSKWPIEESSMYRYPLNGRPAAFFRGDWFVGKGVACARIRIGRGEKDVVEVFCTHLHAPYEREPRYDSYLCHRTAQAWEIAKLMRHAAERGHVVVGLGDFNMLPLSLAHRLIEGHAPVRDIWRVLHPDSAIGAAEDAVEKARRCPVPTAEECLRVHGTTCDSRVNSWRWSKALRKELRNGRVEVDPSTLDPRAKRLDYVFFYAPGWEVREAEVGMTMVHPTLYCSLSDHFSIETTLTRGEGKEGERVEMVRGLPVETYDEILEMIGTYEVRERQQRRLRLAHFGTEVVVSIGCFVAVWWSARNFVAFLLMLLCTVGLGMGILDGLIGGLFVGSELRALKEFEWEVRNARAQASRRQQPAMPQSASADIKQDSLDDGV